MSEIEIMFRDGTMVETKALYEEVNRLVDGGLNLDTWVIDSEFGITKGDDDSHGILRLIKGGDCVITAYSSNFNEVYVPVDLIYLNDYLKDKGWKLFVDDEVSRSDPDFWGRFFSIISEDDNDDVSSEFGYDDDDKEELDFLEYKKKMEGNSRLRSNRMHISDLAEFHDHIYDYEKRQENEREKF